MRRLERAVETSPSPQAGRRTVPRAAPSSRPLDGARVGVLPGLQRTSVRCSPSSVEQLSFRRLLAYGGGTAEGLEILVIGAPNLGEDPREDVDGQHDWWADE